MWVATRPSEGPEHGRMAMSLVTQKPTSCHQLPGMGLSSQSHGQHTPGLWVERPAWWAHRPQLQRLNELGSLHRSVGWCPLRITMPCVDHFQNLLCRVSDSFGLRILFYHVECGIWTRCFGKLERLRCTRSTIIGHAECWVPWMTMTLTLTMMMIWG